MFIKTIAKNSQAKFSEKKSQFTAFIIPITSENEVKEILSQASKNNKEAAHIPFAYKILLKNNSETIQRYNDDGEPSKTAGYPLLKIIEQENLCNILIYVIRVYGGVKLGPAGLMRAFSTSARLALDENEIIEKELTQTKIIDTDIYHFSFVESFLQQQGITFKADFNAQNVRLSIEVSDEKEKLFQEAKRIASK